MNIPYLQEITMTRITILFLRLNDYIKNVWYIAHVLQSRSKEFGTKIPQIYPRG